MKTVSEQTAKALKEAGYPQEDCEFYWVSAKKTDGKNEFWDLIDNTPVHIDTIAEYDYRKDFAAPNAEEILDRLPSELIIKDKRYGFRLWFVQMFKTVRNYCCNYFNLAYGEKGQLITTDFIAEQSAAEAAGKMWLYLKKEGLL